MGAAATTTEDPRCHDADEPRGDLEVTQSLWDFKLVYAALRERGLLEELDRLRRPAPLASTLALGFDWGLIFAAWAAVWWISPWLAPLALLLIGSRQRALGNLLHEAGHRMLYRRGAVNDAVGEGLLAVPFLTRLSHYRKMHFGHHAHLGSAEDDPELIHSEAHRGLSAWRLFLAHALDGAMFRTNVLAGWREMSRGERAGSVAWWAALAGVLALAAGWEAAALFVVLWLAAKATVFHAITTFREISDHVGLVPGTVIGFTRNSPHTPLLSFFLHPHQNNYHLTHHLAPRVPFARIHRAHEIFLRVPEYAAAHHCDGYFGGRRSLIACWVGRCLAWHRALLRAGGPPAR